MSSDHVPPASRRNREPDSTRVVRLVLAWAALTTIVHVIYLLFVFPGVDQAIVLFLSGKNGQGSVEIDIPAPPAAMISTAALVIGVGGSVVAYLLLRVGGKGAHAIAVVSLAMIAASVALTVGGIIAGVVRPQITEPGLWGGLPGLSAAVVFLSQVLLLIGGARGRHARLAT